MYKLTLTAGFYNHILQLLPYILYNYEHLAKICHNEHPMLENWTHPITRRVNQFIHPRGYKILFIVYITT